jgi:uncharacterized DUF497 family protein
MEFDFDPNKSAVNKEKSIITTEEFDELFDNNKNITEYLDLQTAKRGAIKTRRVSVDFPEWMIQQLDKQALKLGVTRQSVIKFWISEKLNSA